MEEEDNSTLAAVLIVGAVVLVAAASLVAVMIKKERQGAPLFRPIMEVIYRRHPTLAGRLAAADRTPRAQTPVAAPTKDGAGA